MISCLCSYVHIDSWPSWGHRWLLGQLPCSRQEAVRAHLAESSQKVKFKKKQNHHPNILKVSKCKIHFLRYAKGTNWERIICFGPNPSIKQKDLNRHFWLHPHICNLMDIPTHAIGEIRIVSIFFGGIFRFDGKIIKTPKPCWWFLNFRW